MVCDFVRAAHAVMGSRRGWQAVCTRTAPLSRTAKCEETGRQVATNFHFVTLTKILLR